MTTQRSTRTPPTVLPKMIHLVLDDVDLWHVSSTVNTTAREERVEDEETVVFLQSSFGETKTTGTLLKSVPQFFPYCVRSVVFDGVLSDGSSMTICVGFSKTQP